MTSPTQTRHEAGAVPTLDAFISAARSAPADHEMEVQHDGQSYRVLAVGRTASGREVTWVRGNQDAVSMFLDAFRVHYGEKVTDAVMRTIGETDPIQGKPLSVRTVKLAQDMADRTLIALNGVDFFENLNKTLRKESVPLTTKS